MARFLLIVVAFLACSSSVNANSQIFAQRHRGGEVYRRAVEVEQDYHASLGFSPNASANFLAMPVDHSDPSKGTFQDKFYYDLTYFNGSGPCMMYLNGEGPLGSAVGGYMASLAQELSACTLSIEHRWYGVSLPSNLTDKALLTSTLNIDQAMADVKYLMDYFSQNVVNGAVTKWFLVGGSYSGAMTVWMNERYPGLFDASWSASGVVKANFAFTDYDGHVKAVVSEDCGQALTNVMRVAEELWEAGNSAKLASLFNFPSYNTKEDMLWGMADASASSVQYGMKTTLCSMVLPQPVDPWDMMTQYAKFVHSQWGENFMASCYYSTECLANEALSAGWGPGGYSWIWQCCSEMAYWQIGYPGSIRSENVSETYFVNQCRGAFYNNTFADVWAFNQRNHGLHPVTQGKIVATQGSDDPWSTTGLSVSQGPTFPVNTAECTDCGHCGSMMSPQSKDPAALVAQRQLVLTSLKSWLM